MDGFEALMTTLAIVGGLALGVERILEVLKHIVDLDNKTIDPHIGKQVDRQAEEALCEAKQLLHEALHTPESQQLLTEPIPTTKVPQTQAKKHGIAADAEIEDELPAPRIPVIPATPRQKSKTSQVLFLQLMGAGIGILLAQIFNIHLVAAFMIPLGGDIQFSTLLDTLISGLIIGGGSQPVHLIMRFMTTRKLPDMPVSDIKETFKPALSNPAEEWVAIPYKGGVKPESLEKVHLRATNPTQIIYHHTAMSSDASFQDIVDEYLVRKKWLTGYHCVIMPDGHIKSFCRWDRTGNHSKDHNQHSLGLAFHGNFHTHVGDLGSNVDGRFGHQEPTPAQLVSAARVVALWSSIYAIPLDFEDNILAHRQVSNNKMAGPGSNFPIQAFQQKIQYFHELWAESDHAHTCIKAFKQKDRLFIKDRGDKSWT